MICEDVIFRKDTAFEAEFQTANGKRKFRQRAVFMFLAVQAYAVFGFFDPLLGGPSTDALLIVRTITVILLSMAWGAFMAAQDQARRECLVFCFATISAASIVSLIAVADGLAADFYPFAFITMQIVGSCLIVPRFRTMAITIPASYAGYWVVMATGSTSHPAMCISAFLLTVTTVAVIVGSYTREKLERDQLRKERALAAARDDALRMAESAERANAAKNRMMANVSHELRTPMNAILGFSEVMKDQVFGPVTPARYQDYIADIHASGRLLLSNIDDLLDMARIEAGKLSWEDRIFPVRDALAMAAKASGTVLAGREIGIVWTDHGDDALIRADFDRFCQAVINLTNNAGKFSPPGSTVTIDFAPVPDGWLLSVVDEGCGIPAADLARIREPFAQIRDSDHDAAKGGLGLGLAITGEIVRRLDSALDISSVEGFGTTVSFLVPTARIVNMEERLTA